ncbi:MAG: sulfotransferase [Mycobacteriales bacterium]
MQDGAGPVLVTGLPRTGTSWVGKMLEVGGELVYVNEPLNPQHPPGRSPGVLNADVTHRFQYICTDNEARWVRAFADTVGLRYRVLAELRRNRSVYDLLRMAKYYRSFTVGRLRGRRALLDDPFAVLSVPWLTERLGVRSVVLVRDPVALVGSWRRLGWSVYFHELLEQPLLVRDLLGPYGDRMRELVGSQDHVAKIAVLWSAVYAAVDRFRGADPRIRVVRYEDLAADPVAGFEDLYRRLALRWTDGVRRRVEETTTAPGGTEKPHIWRLRGGVSRTAFRPMDSRAALQSYRDRLAERDIDRVRELTADVATRFYPDGSRYPSQPGRAVKP